MQVNLYRLRWGFKLKNTKRANVILNNCNCIVGPLNQPFFSKCNNINIHDVMASGDVDALKEASLLESSNKQKNTIEVVRRRGEQRLAEK